MSKTQPDQPVEPGSENTSAEPEGAEPEATRTEPEATRTELGDPPAEAALGAPAPTLDEPALPETSPVSAPEPVSPDARSLRPRSGPPSIPLGPPLSQMAPPRPSADPKPRSVDFFTKNMIWFVVGGGALALIVVGALSAGAVAGYLLTQRGVSPAELIPRAEVGARVTELRESGAGRLEVCSADWASCRTLAKDSRVQPGAFVRSSSGVRARLGLARGGELSLERDSRLVLSESDPNRVRLEDGVIVVELEGSSAPLRVDLPSGHVELRGGSKVALRSEAPRASLDVSRGEATLVATRGEPLKVRAGETARLEPDAPATVSSNPELAQNFAWTDSLGAREEVALRGLGELRAQKPGETTERVRAVVLSQHNVKVRVAAGVARTEVEEVFTNTTDEVLEGIYRFPIPAHARIERLALDVDGRLEEGAFVERDRAGAIWRGAIVHAEPKAKQQLRDEIIWVPGPWRDPALLEWQRGGRFELRIFPIPKRGSRRVILAYTENVPQVAGVRRYTYPLAYDAANTTRVANFRFDLEVRGHDAAYGVSPAGYALERRGEQDSVARYTFEAPDFSPRGDVSVEYALPNRRAELTAVAYAAALGASDAFAAGSGAAVGSGAGLAGEGKRPFVALTLRPKLPRLSERRSRDIAIVVDSSRSMFGEKYDRASAVASRLVRELDPVDRVLVIACDSTCRAVPAGFAAPSAELARSTREFLAKNPPEGASDPTWAVRQAAALARREGGRGSRVVYVGDGTPTVGAVRPGSVERDVRGALAGEDVMLIAVPVGSDADLDTLGALTRGGGGVVVPYVPGQTVAEASYATLGALYSEALRDVELELPAGLHEVAPRRLDNLVSGAEAVIVARAEGLSEITGDIVLRGRLGEQRFEQRYPVRITPSSAPGNAYVPRLFAATRIQDLERESDPAARTEAVRLSKAYGVASRYTSLLVLESEAMFRAFGLERNLGGPAFTGEETAEDTQTEGEVDYDAASERVQRDVAAATGHALGGAGRASVAAPKKKSSSEASDLAFESAPAAPPAATPAPRGPSVPSLPGAFEPEPDFAPWRARRMIPMRRVWERSGEISESLVPRTASPSKLADAQRRVELEPDRRTAVKELYSLYALAGDVERAGEVAERWSLREPLDPEALTARADIAARRGDRELAIRILGSVVDVRPDDVKAQVRLARLHRWAGRPELACRHQQAISELRPNDPALLADAVHCLRATGSVDVASALIASATDATRRASEARPQPANETAPASGTALRGDLRAEASWTADADVDLAFVDAEGNRISWLGAPTRAVISAADVTSRSREELAVRGAKPGEYAVEVVRGAGRGAVSGTLRLFVAGTERRLPFVLNGDRVAVGTVRIVMNSRLVPAAPNAPQFAR